MSKTIHWGIIGCGEVAEHKSGPAFQKCQNSNLLGVMRRDLTLAKDFAERHHVPYFFNNADALISHPDISAIYIATPPSSHLPYALKVLDANKHVYIEKPMALSVEEAKTLQKAVSNSTAKLVVAHYRRFLPMYLKIKQLLDDQIIGKVLFIDLTFIKPADFNQNPKWRLNASLSGGGYFHDLAPHQIDLLLYFFGPIKTVKGIAINQSKSNSVDDAISAIIDFKNNIQFKGFWHFSAPNYLNKDNCTLYGEKGMLQFSFYQDTLHLTLNQQTQKIKLEHPEHLQQPLIQETVNYFLGKSQNPCPVEVGLEVTNIIEQITNQ